ncbi:FkbM family methyltransferase [Streptomyces sp. NPDC058417]|uniref:FkbM family methyltransferase n=1 Tax=unclassified Streptomyces TaxID=2593676 RepID=UPI00364B5E59
MPPGRTEVADGVHVHAVSALDARFLYREIFESGTYAGVALPEEPFVVDVGANIGLFTLYVKQQRPRARVLAFEPLPELVAALRANTAAFGLDGVETHEVALGGEESEAVPFRYYPLLPSSSTLYPQDQGRLKELLGRSFPPRVVDRMFRGREVTVRVERLSRRLDPRRPVDLLKIDAVGAELEILRGIDEHLRPLLRTVLVDVQDVGGRVVDLCAFLEGAGLDVSVLRPPAATGDDGLNRLIRAVRT